MMNPQTPAEHRRAVRIALNQLRYRAAAARDIGIPAASDATGVLTLVRMLDTVAEKLEDAKRAVAGLISALPEENAAPVNVEVYNYLGGVGGDVHARGWHYRPVNAAGEWAGPAVGPFPTQAAALTAAADSAPAALPEEPAKPAAEVCADCGADEPQDGGCPARADDALPCRMRPDVDDRAAKLDPWSLTVARVKGGR